MRTYNTVVKKREGWLKIDPHKVDKAKRGLSFFVHREFVVYGQKVVRNITHIVV
jgi:hypothetical protein